MLGAGSGEKMEDEDIPNTTTTRRMKRCVQDPNIREVSTHACISFSCERVACAAAKPTPKKEGRRVKRKVNLVYPLRFGMRIYALAEKRKAKDVVRLCCRFN